MLTTVADSPGQGRRRRAPTGWFHHPCIKLPRQASAPVGKKASERFQIVWSAEPGGLGLGPIHARARALFEIQTGLGAPASEETSALGQEACRNL